MYHPKDPTIVGIYIGQAMKIGARISEHEKDLDVVKNLRKPRRRKGKPKNQTRHIKFWHQGGIHDFWLVFGQFDRPTTRDGLEQLGLFLNILEMYAALILQSLPRTLLRLNLPKNASIGLYPWEGLNAFDLTRQPLNHLGQSNRRSKPHWRPFDIRKAKGEGSLWRHADTSKGDKPRVDLVCSHCFNPHSHYTDHDPRYNITTGLYVARVVAVCTYCDSSSIVIFVPRDRKTKWKHFSNISHKYALLHARQNLSGISLREELNHQSCRELSVRLELKGQGSASYWWSLKSKSILLPITEALFDYLEGPQNERARHELKIATISFSARGILSNDIKGSKAELAKARVIRQAEAMFGHFEGPQGENDKRELWNLINSLRKRPLIINAGIQRRQKSKGEGEKPAQSHCELPPVHPGEGFELPQTRLNLLTVQLGKQLEKLLQVHRDLLTIQTDENGAQAHRVPLITQTREQLGKSSRKVLQAWIRGQGFQAGAMKRDARLRALAIWDKKGKIGLFHGGCSVSWVLNFDVWRITDREIFKELSRSQIVTWIY